MGKLQVKRQILTKHEMALLTGTPVVAEMLRNKIDVIMLEYDYSRAFDILKAMTEWCLSNCQGLACLSRGDSNHMHRNSQQRLASIFFENKEEAAGFRLVFADADDMGFSISVV